MVSVASNLENVVNVRGRQINVAALTNIDETDLISEYAAQPATYAYFAVLWAETRAARDAAEDAYKREVSLAFVSFKNDDDYIPKGSRTVTDGLADMLASADEEVTRLKKAHLEADREYRIVDAIVRALDMRANMLVSMGAQLRSEADMEGMSLRESVNDPGQVARRAMKKVK